MAKKSKRYRNATESADLLATYPLEEAVEVLKKMPKAGFDETVELSLHLGVDPRRSDQMVRGTVDLPNGSGKKVVVVAFTENEQAALDAGADYAGLDELIKKIQGGWLDFDKTVATPSAMRSVRTVARVLGPRGMMPNPKAGTVSDNLTDTIDQIKSGGRVEFKMDKTANIGVVVGKCSFDTSKLVGNINKVLEVIGRARPGALKGRYIKNATVTATQSPGVKLDPSLYTNL